MARRTAASHRRRFRLIRMAGLGGLLVGALPGLLGTSAWATPRTPTAVTTTVTGQAPAGDAVPREVTARWEFDREAEAGANSVPGGPAMTLGGGAKLVPGTGFLGEGGLLLDGKRGYASSTVPVDTGTSFTVTAWVQTSVESTRRMTLVSAAGNTTSSFRVDFVPARAHRAGGAAWEATMARTDTAGSKTVSAVNAGGWNSGTDWNHLAVVYDAPAQQLHLYVNGQLGTAPCFDDDRDGAADDPQCVPAVPWADHARSFTAQRSLQVGRAKSHGTFGDHWSGAIDDVWAFRGALSSEQINYLSSGWVGLPTEVPDIPEAG
ncbi:LamG domain-containing protein [Streptomyces sp. NEAU-S7GS2]|uniref:LamG domain-containing protein n=1 Tax=Streptomyces sp. NEAU-S7GS2 TaxID=2202000 RepID=UPI0013A57415|nr:LamG domain-containing protein [Streptomyces sp. NEAU-S7GS2]